MSYRIKGVLLIANRPDDKGMIYSEKCLKKMVEEYNKNKKTEKLEWNDENKSVEGNFYISNSYPNLIEKILNELISYKNK